MATTTGRTRSWTKRRQVSGPAIPGDGLWQAPPSLPSGSGRTAARIAGITRRLLCPAVRMLVWRRRLFVGQAPFQPGLCRDRLQYDDDDHHHARTSRRSPKTRFPFRTAIPACTAVFLGYHLSDCGGDINFTYWNLQSTAATTLGPANVTDGTNVIFGQVLNNPADGQYLNASSGIRMNIYDIDFSKYLIYGGPGKPCDCNFCPRWDMRWFAGVRIAQVNRFDNNSLSNPDGSIAATGHDQRQLLRCRSKDRHPSSALHRPVAAILGLCQRKHVAAVGAISRQPDAERSGRRHDPDVDHHRQRQYVTRDSGHRYRSRRQLSALSSSSSSRPAISSNAGGIWAMAKRSAPAAVTQLRCVGHLEHHGLDRPVRAGGIVLLSRSSDAKASARPDRSATEPAPADRRTPTRWRCLRTEPATAVLTVGPLGRRRRSGERSGREKAADATLVWFPARAICSDGSWAIGICSDHARTAENR